MCAPILVAFMEDLILTLCTSFVSATLGMFISCNNDLLLRIIGIKSIMKQITLLQ
jgi:hypothetical protein